MAVTKRVRFEVLRRDNHTCQYCGEKAPNVILHIDHVMPKVLGGDDTPGNLVTACRDCNAGKTSIMPDSPLVQGLSEKAAAYALGMQDKMTRFRQDLESLEDYVEEFDSIWNNWYSGGDPDNKLPKPADYKMSLFGWLIKGVPTSAFELAIPVAMKKESLRGECGEFQYMAGIIQNMLNSREIDMTVTKETCAVYTEKEAQEIHDQGYCSGRRTGDRLARESFVMNDPLRIHVDGDLPKQTFEEVFPDG